jgi:threonine dehydrogenase-like Zn-dependent dehydrogenase
VKAVVAQRAGEVALISARDAIASDYRDAIGLVAPGRTRTAPLVPARLPVEGAQRAFGSRGSDSGQLKIVLDIPTS